MNAQFLRALFTNYLMSTRSAPIVLVQEIHGVPSSHEKSDLPNLDFMRAVAVLLVLFGQLTYLGGITNLGPLTTYWMGAMGVRFFFVHTCLVLMLSLERQWKKQGGAELFTSFMIRRIFRIYPLSVAIVFFVVALRLPMAVIAPSRFFGLPLHPALIVSNLLLVQGPGHSILGPMWSLPYEMAMYVILPWLFLFLYPNKSHWRISAVWLISVLSCLAFLSYAGRTNAEYFFLYIPCFLPGVVAFQLQRTQRQRLPSILWPELVLGIVLLSLYRQTLIGNGWFKSWILCLSLGLAVPFFDQISARWLRVPSFLIAKYSYGIYLTHFFCLWFALDRLHNSVPPLARLALFAVFVTVLPVLFYHLLEEPMILLGKRVAKRFEMTIARGRLAAVRVPS